MLTTQQMKRKVTHSMNNTNHTLNAYTGTDTKLSKNTKMLTTVRLTQRDSEQA